MRLSATLRLARPDDIDLLLEYFKEFHISSPYADLEFDPAKVRQMLEVAIPDRRKFVLLVSVDAFDQPVGVLAATKTQPTFSSQSVAAELAWYIDPAYRTGRRAIEQLVAYEAWAKSSGCKYPQVSKLSTSPKSVDLLYGRRGYFEVEKSYIKEI